MGVGFWFCAFTFYFFFFIFPWAGLSVFFFSERVCEMIAALVYSKMLPLTES